jgi:hypothetical protein
MLYIMENLLDRKEKIIEKYLPKVIEKRTAANLEILKLLEKALKDRKIDFNLQMDILKKITTSGNVHSDSTVKMDGEQQLEMVKLWLGNAKDAMDAISNDIKNTYDSYLTSINNELQICRDELNKIDDELRRPNDNDVPELQKQRKKIEKKKKKIEQYSD